MTGFIKRLEAASARERALVLGALAVISALLSWRLPPPHWAFFREIPLPPALWFGLVLCAGVALWSSRRLFVLAVVLIATFVAWQAAVETTLRIEDQIERQIVSLTPPNGTLSSLNLNSPGINYVWGLCGMVGGMIGSAIVVFGIAAVLKGFRKSNCWAPVIVFGTIAGFFLEFAEVPAASGLFVHIDSTLPVFLVWQVGVAALIAYNLTPAAKDSGQAGKMAA